MPRKSRQQKGGVWPFDTDTDACKSAKAVETAEVAAAAAKRELACKPVETAPTQTALFGGKRRRKTASKRASQKRKSRKSRK